MDANAYRLNKILGLVLGSALVLQVLHLIDENFTPTRIVAKPASEPAGKPTGDATAAAQSFERALASASAERGAQTAKECEVCHNLAKGQGSKVGPDLYGVVGRKVASEPSFNYSTALKAKGGTWTFNALNTWLTNPRSDVPGTLMTFAGIASEKQRADVVAYLNSNSDTPVPLPKTEAQGKPATPIPSKEPPSPATPPGK
jgi:cytochrome c